MKLNFWLNHCYKWKVDKSTGLISQSSQWIHESRRVSWVPQPHASSFRTHLKISQLYAACQLQTPSKSINWLKSVMDQVSLQLHVHFSAWKVGSTFVSNVCADPCFFFFFIFFLHFFGATCSRSASESLEVFIHSNVKGMLFQLMSRPGSISLTYYKTIKWEAESKLTSLDSICACALRYTAITWYLWYDNCIGISLCCANFQFIFAEVLVNYDGNCLKIWRESSISKLPRVFLLTHGNKMLVCLKLFFC